MVVPGPERRGTYSNIDSLLNSVEPWVMVSAVGENEYCTPLFAATKSGSGSTRHRVVDLD
jgi:hypothetical protein